MKKIIFILMGFVIIIQSFGIYKLIKQPAAAVTTKNVVISSSPQIIYKDRIVYKTNPIDEKIVFQSRMLFKLMLSGNHDNSKVKEECIFDTLPFGHDTIETELNTQQGLLDDLTMYNKTHPNGYNLNGDLNAN